MKNVREALEAKIELMSDDQVKVLDQILAEYNRAVAKFPEWPNRILDAVAVLQEEVGELQKEALHTVYEPDKVESDTSLFDEGVQAAAMAFRFLLSVSKYDTCPSRMHDQNIGS